MAENDGIAAGVCAVMVGKQSLSIGMHLKVRDAGRRNVQSELVSWLYLEGMFLECEFQNAFCSRYIVFVQATKRINVVPQGNRLAISDQVQPDVETSVWRG